jgi:hypothetical protein
LRREYLGWLGIAGTALSLSQAAEAFLPGAVVVQAILEYWSTMTRSFWALVLPFVPTMNQADTIMLNTILFISALEIAALRKLESVHLSIKHIEGQEEQKYALVANIGMVACIVAMGVAVGYGASAKQGLGLFWYLDVSLFAPGLDIQGLSDPDEISRRITEWRFERFGMYLSGGPFQDWGWILSTFALYAVPTAIAASGRWFGYYHSHRARAARIWRIIALVLVIVALNSAGAWVERQVW